MINRQFEGVSRRYEDITRSEVIGILQLDTKIDGTQPLGDLCMLVAERTTLTCMDVEDMVLRTADELLRLHVQMADFKRLVRRWKSVESHSVNDLVDLVAGYTPLTREKAVKRLLTIINYMLETWKEQ